MTSGSSKHCQKYEEAEIEKPKNITCKLNVEIEKPKNTLNVTSNDKKVALSQWDFVKKKKDLIFFSKRTS